MKRFTVYLVGVAAPVEVRYQSDPTDYEVINGQIMLRFGAVASFSLPQVIGWHCVDEIDTSLLYIGSTLKFGIGHVMCISDDHGVPVFKKVDFD